MGQRLLAGYLLGFCKEVVISYGVYKGMRTVENIVSYMAQN
jgi:hypothetical protein